MAQFNENIKIVAPNPIDDRYLSLRTSAGSQLPYSGVSEVYTIPTTVRYEGLTVLVESGTSNIEYWFKDGIGNGNLEEKKFASEQLVGDFITGATNLGYFEGQNGLQTLTITQSNTAYDGTYYPKLNNYYRDALGYVRFGSPTHDGPLRRLYVGTILTLKKSWIYDVNHSGWVILDGDAEQYVDENTLVIGSSVGIPPFTEEKWWYTGGTLNNGFYQTGGISVSVVGNLYSGDTITVGNPIYSYKSYQELNLRTILNDTPEFLKIGYDNNYIRFSGATSVITGDNVGGGAGVYKTKTGSTLQFRTLVSSGDTTVTQVGDEIRIYSAGGTGAISVANLSGGTGEIYKDTSGTTINLRTLLGTGDVVITTTGDTVVIDSQGGGGTYDLDSPSVIDVGGISGGTVLTGKTSFELWEELLVPTQYPALTIPSVSTSLSQTGTYEVGTTLSSLDVCSSYNAGSINPQYTATSDCRSDGVIGYCFGSTGGQCDGYYVDAVTLHVETIPTYTICDGTQTWCTSACHCAGVQPYDSKGDSYCSPLDTGFTIVSSVNLCGLYAWFWGSTVSAPTINQALLDSYSTCGGGKCVGDSSGAITVDNFDVSGRYIWFAIPAACGPTKTKWDNLSNPLDDGSIPDIFMASAVVCSMDSPDTCGWTGINYEFYLSNGVTSIDYGMEFSN